ncbi:MAG: hypothetical protein ONB48_14715 [candidate division KSB1 bacterium]|nr:hypothetical protein [candidate division KSB1 bacterium]MDZ7273511.1 hypothetical protein [candidate division KSB1 bacterium]MDZ7286898.1 hypothetical protein [candidate division KSB1 bacterium]MDZ7299749.1 hypothetical protein [candidate division KSB1 bacterium]MDZ7305688.1 hypothetical protein [candidate division KSB1 bacterium]
MRLNSQILRAAPVIIAWGLLIVLARAGVFTERFYGLPILFVLVSVATAFFPVPVNVLILLAGQATSGVAVVTIAAAATFFAFLLEYFIYDFIVQRGRMLDVKNVKLIARLFTGFRKHPFPIIALAAFLPISSEPLRLYAISVKYNKYHFALAGVLGRGFRFAALLWIGALLGTPDWLLVLVMLLPGVLLLIVYGLRKIRLALAQARSSSSLPAREGLALAPDDLSA